MGRMILERAEKIAETVLKQLAPYCKPNRIVVAGSVRRRRPWVNDIDFVLVPADLWQLHQTAKRLGQVKAAGGKLMRVMMGDTQLDFYLATDETWATLLLIRTGSTKNNIRLCSRAKELGWKLHADGSGLFNQYDKRIAGDTELSIYQALGLPFQTPEERQ